MAFLVFLNVIKKRTRDIQPRLVVSRSAESLVWFMLLQSKQRKRYRIRDWSLITGRGGGYYKMGKSQV